MRVHSLYVHPIKSARGISLQTARLERSGFEHDRTWVVARPDGVMLTQREVPRLSQVEVALSGDRLAVAIAGQLPLQVPVAAPCGKSREIHVWEDRPLGIHAGPEAERWFSEALRLPCALYRLAPDNARWATAPDGSSQAVVGFVDAFPGLVLSTASLEDLNCRLPSPIPMSRFRPNLVVSGCDPYSEDSWPEIRIGPVVLRMVKACARCTITTIDEVTSTPGKEPLRTLAAFRKNGSKILLGRYFIPLAGGTISVGDPVSL